MSNEDTDYGFPYLVVHQGFVVSQYEGLLAAQNAATRQPGSRIFFWNERTHTMQPRPVDDQLNYESH